MNRKPDTKREKILVYNTSFFDVSQTFIYHQVKTLAQNYDVHLLASKFINPHNFAIDHFEQHTVQKLNGWTGRIANKYFNVKLFNPATYLQLKKLFRKNRFKAVHAHFGTKALEILPLAKWYQVPLVVSFHGADASRMMKHEDYVKKLPGLFDYASAIIISSMHMAENLGLEKWKDKMHFIPYGVNPDKFEFSISKNGVHKSESVKILHSGRLTGKKGVPDLIKVFNELESKYKKLELHLVGDGEELDECKSLVRKFGIEQKVWFYGAVSHEVVKDKLKEADIFVLNSRVDQDGDMEGTPVTLLEAMSMGKAVVSTTHAGIPYVIEHAKNGYLASERSNPELKECIEKLIADKNLRQNLGHKARETIEHSYTFNIMEEKIKKVFREI